MRPEQINLKIAEICGIIKGQAGWIDLNKSKAGEIPYYATLPDYVNSLDAMHEAEKVLTDEQYGPHYSWEPPHHHDKNTDNSFAWNLWKIVESSYTDEQRPCKVRAESATAIQRAEAFLKCLGKWEEGS